jgi:P-type Ca2+ transporter type 2C
MGEESTSSPPRIITNSPSNLLNVPGTGPSPNHQRSASFGSSAASGTSGWGSTSQSPSTAFTSDVGDSKGETRNLLKSDNVEAAEIPDNPFAFTPKMLAKLHDPKDLDVLREMGGLDGLVFGLRSDVKKGLSPEEDKLQGRITLQNVWDELERRKKENVKQGIDDKLQQEENEQKREFEVILEKSADEKMNRNESRKSSASRRPTLATVISTPAVSKGFSDRKRIFSENRIPARKPKNIFQLMWMALHDKILVRISIYVCLR